MGVGVGAGTSNGQHGHAGGERGLDSGMGILHDVVCEGDPDRRTGLGLAMEEHGPVPLQDHAIGVNGWK